MKARRAAREAVRDAIDAVQAVLAERCAALELDSPASRVRFLLVVQTMIGEAIQDELGNMEQVVSALRRSRRK